MTWTVLLAAGLLCGSGEALQGRSAGSQEGAPTAPDGRPGLGTARTAHELGRMFASPDADQEAFLRELHELPSEVLIRREMVRRDYRELGYFELLDRMVPQDLAGLHAKYRELDQSALPTLMTAGRESQAFTKLFLDLRFQIRMSLIETFDVEVTELRKGLALLHASQDGLFDLRDSEAKAIASRIDLASAILRSIRLDFDALRERGDARAPGAPDPAWMAELIGLTKLRTESDRSAALDRLRRKLAGRIDRLESALFWPRLETKVATQLARRSALADEAATHLERIQRFLLVPPYDQDPPSQLAAMSKTDRHRYALSEAVRGLAADPLHEELSYWMGVASDLIDTPRESRAWFDRFLALRGIRAQDARTTTGRELTFQEKYALEKVMQALSGIGVPGR